MNGDDGLANETITIRVMYCRTDAAEHGFIYGVPEDYTVEKAIDFLEGLVAEGWDWSHKDDDRSKLDFTHFKRRKQGNRQVGGTERPGLSVYQGRRRTVKNPPTPATGGGAPERWHPRRSATAWRTKPLCDGPRVVVAAADGLPGWSRRRVPSGLA